MRLVGKVIANDMRTNGESSREAGDGETGNSDLWMEREEKTRKLILPKKEVSYVRVVV